MSRQTNGVLSVAAVCDRGKMRPEIAATIT